MNENELKSIERYFNKFNEDAASFNEFEANDFIKLLKNNNRNDDAIEVGSTFLQMAPSLKGYINQYGYALYNKFINIDDEKNMILLGFIGFLDPPKESAKSAIQKLNRAGIRVIVLTGDNAEVTECICKKVGINSKNIVQGNQIENLADAGVLRLLKKTNIFVKLSPIEKARIVRLLKESGNVVGYMGDGINDAPSLTNSDVGISVDTAVDIAKESADIILLEKDLNVLLDGVEERKTYICKLNEIYQNGNKFQLWRSCICNCSKYIFAIFTGNTNSIIS